MHVTVGDEPLETDETGGAPVDGGDEHDEEEGPGDAAEGAEDGAEDDGEGAEVADEVDRLGHPHQPEERDAGPDELPRDGGGDDCAPPARAGAGASLQSTRGNRKGRRRGGGVQVDVGVGLRLQSRKCSTICSGRPKKSCGKGGL